MRPAEEGLLLLRCALGRPLAPLSEGEYQTLSRLLRERFPERRAERLTECELRLLGYETRTAERIARLLERSEAVERYFAAAEDVRAITRISDDFPRRLRLLGAHCPPALFCRGDCSLLNRPAVCLVGSRRLSEENRRFARTIGALAAREGRVLISGGATGADTEAQNACLEAGGSVICFVPDALLRRREHPRVLYCSDEGYELPFTAARALRRNHYIHTAAELSFVAQCEAGKGGTWSGASDALRRGLTPLFVFRDGSRGCAALVDLGAVPVDANVTSFASLRPMTLSIFD